MDTETKAIVTALLETVREVTDCAFEAQEMAWKTFGALQTQPGYKEAYQSQKGDLLEQIQAKRLKILTRLSAQIERLEEHN